MTDVRLAELLAALSLATDLGTAFPLEKALRNALLAVNLGRELGLATDDLSDAYYMAMLRFLGCSAFAHELAAASIYEPVDVTRPARADRRCSVTRLRCRLGSHWSPIRPRSPTESAAARAPSSCCVDGAALAGHIERTLGGWRPPNL